MSNIKKIPRKDFDKLSQILTNAYPAMGTHVPSECKRMKEKLLSDEKLDNIGSYGWYDGDQLLGAMRLFDFPGTLFETRILYGGVGMVAVDLAHKKERIARDLMLFYLRHYRERKSPLAVLYPFRPDFYAQMGFGYGAKINEYLIRSDDLSDSGDKQYLVDLSGDDIEEIVSCYNRVAKKTHGMFLKSDHELSRLTNPAIRLIGYRKGKRLSGYMAFTFKRMDEDNFVLNDLVVREMICENRNVRASFMTYLRSQADQVRRIVFHLSEDHLHFLPFDPRDGSDRFVGLIAQQTNRQGVAMMYRIINLPELMRRLKNHSFGGESLRLRLNLRDSFLPENDGEYLIDFVKGKPKLKKSGRIDLSITMNVEYLSSLIMGTVSFDSLYRYGLADISDEKQTGRINKLFGVSFPPVCYTQF